MNIVLIMAKEGSIGLPDKNIWDIKGKTLLGWTIEEALNSKQVDKVFVSTNGGKVAAIAQQAGAEVIRRENELARNERFMDAVDQAVQLIKKKYPDLEIIAIPQCVVPFRDPDIFDRCISFLLKHEEYDSAVTIRRTGYIPEALMKIKGEDLVPYFPETQPVLIKYACVPCSSTFFPKISAYFVGWTDKKAWPKHGENVAVGSVTPSSVPATFAV